MNKRSICPNYDLCNQVGGETMYLFMSNFKNNKTMKAIEVKIVDLQPMDNYTPSDKGYKVRNGYIVIYPDGYNYWCPKEVADKAYFKLGNDNNGDIILKQNVEDFIAEHTVSTIGSKTTLVHATTITGFELIDYSACVSPENYSQELGEKYAMENIVNKVWSYLGFVLQWAKNGLNAEKKDNIIPPHVQRMIKEYKKLNFKYIKLGTFIDSSDKFKELCIEEQNDMIKQYDIMKDYLNVLGNRLRRVKIDISEEIQEDK